MERLGGRVDRDGRNCGNGEEGWAKVGEITARGGRMDMKEKKDGELSRKDGKRREEKKNGKKWNGG